MYQTTFERQPQGKDVDSVAICAQKALSFFITTGFRLSAFAFASPFLFTMVYMSIEE